MGRKRIDPEKKKVPYPISIAQGDLKFLREQAEQEGVTVSSIFTSMIKQYIMGKRNELTKKD
ncbi:hypothetical protein [Bacillus cereus group sp. BfR-BA-01323]|uniref:hypothetical protein n=1 Tax=Bacillus cereus group sp. BfR-BA-01323 TaxID=2920299 RepID=UPI001F59885D